MFLKKPIWINIIGILMILGGAIGICGGIWSYTVDSMGVVDIKTEEHYIQKRIDKLNSGNHVPNEEQIQQAKKEGKEAFNRINSVLGSSSHRLVVLPLLSAITFISGILLLMLKPYAIKFFYVVIGLSFLNSVYAFYSIGNVGSAFNAIKNGALIFDVLVDVVFLLVVILGNKSIFSLNTKVPPLESA
jgi:hypothetical protein